MAQSQKPRSFQCDCNLPFESRKLLGEHVEQTGHMETKWCAVCNQPFFSEKALTQHMKDAPKHKVNRPLRGSASNTNSQRNASGTSLSNSKGPQRKPSKAAAAKDIPDSSLAVQAPSTITIPRRSKRLMQAANASTATPNTSPAVQNTVTLVATASTTPTQTVAMVPSSPLDEYPWASRRTRPGLLKTLTARCHSEGILVEYGYYTGGRAEQKRIKANPNTFLSTPARTNNGVAKHKAIAIDCEMVGVAGGREELALLCAVDVLTGAVLINSFVYPIETVKDWRTKYSGVSKRAMTEAHLRGETLNGWPEARDRLFRFADADTVLIGHALHGDLKVLRVVHKRVIDSSILVGEAVFGKGNKIGRQWGLQTLCRELLGAAIQVSKKKGHVCLEDTLATREIVLWCLTERERLEVWAKQALVQYKIDKEKREQQQREKERERREKEERKRKEEEKLKRWEGQERERVRREEEKRVEQQREDEYYHWGPAYNIANVGSN